MTKETLEEAAEIELGRLAIQNSKRFASKSEVDYTIGFIQGAKWQAERMYSEEDLREAFIAGGNSCIEEDDDYGSAYDAYMKE